ncbi:uncharacterized protein BO72DRAFT_54496 [Aspergillus fijiensis CBS 313.89]|uniref:Uncharacterized protein n=1 Tax=Aspergillus fijiensis CBS 313.89 TaxID=1448319 RepID=A0A8G1RUP3_9EURO|nr:uncharacterized protein BO72DRAFT_54496 [Aspergillus fijiensis CBS 313.89]RAK79214.1 hypothetical protein BO72DRAFT_54496 [Aspergillus fijiensis CBS 313.89]
MLVNYGFWESSLWSGGYLDLVPVGQRYLIDAGSGCSTGNLWRVCGLRSGDWSFFFFFLVVCKEGIWGEGGTEGKGR